MTRDELKAKLKPHVIKMQGLKDSSTYQKEYILPIAEQWFNHNPAMNTTDLFNDWNEVVLEIANEFTIH